MRRQTGWQRESRRLGDAYGFKACTQCGERKRLDAYYHSIDPPGEVRPVCKACDQYHRPGKPIFPTY